MLLKRGSKGTDVIKLQNLLGGLEPDGILGKKTLAALLSAVAKEYFYAQLEGETTVDDVEA